MVLKDLNQVAIGNETMDHVSIPLKSSSKPVWLGRIFATSCCWDTMPTNGRQAVACRRESSWQTHFPAPDNGVSVKHEECGSQWPR